MEAIHKLTFVRSALYVPGSNARALEKARGLDADMLIIDLEDAVPEDAKDAARRAAAAYVAAGAGGKILAIRANGMDSVHHAGDVAALKGCAADLVVLPKVEGPALADFGLPLLAMIETPAGLYAAPDIAAHPSVAGLIAGVNDIAAETGIKPGPSREGLELFVDQVLKTLLEPGLSDCLGHEGADVLDCFDIHWCQSFHLGCAVLLTLDLEPQVG